MIKLAFYGKGGIGKSTTVSNLSVAWAQKGLTVLQIGCDPKADSTLSLREGKKIPTVMEKVRAAEPFGLDDVLFVREIRPDGIISESDQNIPEPGKTISRSSRDTTGGGQNSAKPGRIICAEAGGPLPGMGCAGRGIITALDKLAELGIYEQYAPDIVVYDVLGDVVCGGFAMPMRGGYAQKVYILTSGENMSIYAAANIGLALERFQGRGYASLGGLILNRRDVPDEDKKTQELAGDLHTKIIASLPFSKDVREAENRGQVLLEAFPDALIAQKYRELAETILAQEKERK